MTDDLMERLNAWGADDCPSARIMLDNRELRDDVREAAAEIERLRQRVESAEHSMNEYLGRMLQLASDKNRAEAERDECVKRLRAFHNAGDDAPHWVRRDSLNTLREIGVEP